MRIIGTIGHENDARRFCSYLNRQGIESDVEVFFEPVGGHMSYQIWIHDEDRIDEAKIYLQKFEEHPQAKEYELIEETPEQIEVAPAHAFGTHLTLFFIFSCVFIFFLSVLQELALEKPAMVPIQEALLYDLPPDINGPYWKGAYNFIVAFFTHQDPSAGEGPLFLKIREGQVWRTFTPVLLHYDLLHIAFNMLWLWALGRPIEQRIGPLRLGLFTLLCGIFSNTVQYLMSGPFFLGYSGIIAAMAGFIWMREKIAPWEGYPVTRSTFIFLLVFILAIFAMQVGSFLIQIFTGKLFAPNIANAAHISGALLGILLARLSFFARRHA